MDITPPRPVRPRNRMTPPSLLRRRANNMNINNQQNQNPLGRQLNLENIDNINIPDIPDIPDIPVQNIPVDKRKEVREYLLGLTPLIKKNSINVSVDSKINVYDFEENETLELDPFNLNNSNVVFKAVNSYFQYPKTIFKQHIDNVENIIFDCRARKDFAPLIDEVYYNRPYYLLRGSGNFLLPLNDLIMLLDSSINVFEIKKTSIHLAHTTSLESILVEGSTGVLGQEVDISSADHCQAGSSRDVYEIVPVQFVPKSKGGGSFFSKKKTSSMNRRNPFYVHTLTATKKNIEKKEKSMNKAKKILGYNKTMKKKSRKSYQRRPQ